MSSRRLAWAGAVIIGSHQMATAGPSYLAARAHVTPVAPIANGHRAATRLDLDTLKKQFRRADSADARVTLLEKMAGVSGTNSDLVARALARGLKDDSFLVRAKAAKLLGGLTGNSEALDALLDAGQAFPRERAEAMKAPSLKLPKIGDKNGLEKLEKVQAQADAFVQRLEDLAKYEGELVQALLPCKDERCVKVLGQLLQSAPLDPYGKSILDWLFEYGTAPAVEQVMDYIAAVAKQLKRRARDRKELARTKPRRTPRQWDGNRDSWRDLEERRLKNSLVTFDALTSLLEDRLDEFGDIVREHLKRTPLAPAPPAMDSKAWAKWWKSEEAKLGGL